MHLGSAGLRAVLMEAPGSQTNAPASLETMQSEYHPDCVVCGRDNPTGFGLEFRLVAPQTVEASFACDRRLQGYRDWVHGGVVAAILDGAMTNCLFLCGLVAVTAELKVRFRRPLPTGTGATVRAWLGDTVGSLHIIRAEIRHGGRIAASAFGKFIEHSGRLKP